MAYGKKTMWLDDLLNNTERRFVFPRPPPSQHDTSVYHMGYPATTVTFWQSKKHINVLL